MVDWFSSLCPGILTHAETIVRLKTHKLADHIVLVSAEALDFCQKNVFWQEGGGDIVCRTVKNPK